MNEFGFGKWENEVDSVESDPDSRLYAQVMWFLIVALSCS